VEDGAYHVVGGGVRLGEGGRLGVKVNARVGGGLCGVQLVTDTATGVPIGLLDTTGFTAARTAAVAMVAAEAVGATVTPALVIGTGRVARTVARALCERAASGLDRPAELEIYGRDITAARAIAEELTSVHDAVRAVQDVRNAARRARLIVTATSAAAPLLALGDVSPGVTIIALGADAPGKQELDPRLLAAGSVVVDSLTQCARCGELSHALRAGLLRPSDVRAELAAVVAGRRVARSTPRDIVVVDSTGVATADVAVAGELLAAARAAGVGTQVRLF
jgi:ornithine cyclodeaminase/alanine dehydrogenase-like protein (mu-crystallin family)